MPRNKSLRENPRKILQGGLAFFSKWGAPFAVLAIILFALLLRLINYTGVLDYDVLGYAYYAYGATQGNFEFTLTARAIDFRFALILPLAFLYQLLGPSEFSTVLYSLSASLLAVLGIYGIGRLQGSESAGIIAALLWAAFPLNVFLSTLFGPDEILASFTIAAVFCFLLGRSRNGWQKSLAYAGATIFALLCVFVKPSGIIVLPLLLFFFIEDIYVANKETIKAGISSLPKRFRRFVISDLFVVAVLAVLGFAARQSTPLLVSLFRGAKDLTDTFVLGQTQERLPGRGWIFVSEIFLTAGPIFIVAFSGLVNQRKPPVSSILWAAWMLLYFEWGSISTDPTIYTPFVARTNDRNILFVFAPFAVLAGLFAGQWLSAGKARLLAILSLLIVVPLAWWLKLSNFSGLPLDLISLATVFALIGTLLLPIAVYIRQIWRRELWVFASLFILLIALLFPTPPHHISDDYWQRQIAYRNAITQAGRFFLDSPRLPIVALSETNARELDFFSNFQLGYSDLIVSRGDARIQVTADPRTWQESAYIFLRDEINQLQPVPSTWWKVAEYDPGYGRPILIYRILSEKDAQEELAMAWAAAKPNPDVSSLERLLGAAVNAGEVKAVIAAWIQINKLSPGERSLDLINPTIQEAFRKNDFSFGPDLLVDPEESGLQVDSSLIDAITTKGSEIFISVPPQTSAQRGDGIYQYISLEPNSAYIFIVEVQSNVGVDLARVDRGNITDSHDYAAIYGEGEEKVIFFVTPNWQSPETVRFDLFTITAPGQIVIANPHLYQVELAQP